MDRFILDFIDSVLQLEALLLLWRSRPRAWMHEQLGKPLYLDEPATAELLERLAQRGLIAEVPRRSREYRYEADERDRVLSEVEAAHRDDLIRISTMIRKKRGQSAK